MTGAVTKRRRSAARVPRRASGRGLRAGHARPAACRPRPAACDPRPAACGPGLVRLRLALRLAASPCGLAPFAARLAALASAALSAPFARRLRALGRGLGVRAALGLEALGVAHLDLLVDEALDRAQQRAILGAHQRERLAGGARPAGAADAVHVILGDVRQVEVHDVRQVLDVEAARRDVGRDQHLHLALLEVLERADARVLALVAVDRVGVDAVLAAAARRGGWRRAWSCRTPAPAPSRSSSPGARAARACGLARPDRRTASPLRRWCCGAPLRRSPGSSRNCAESLRISSEKVAEKSSVWRMAAGSSAMMRLDVGDEAHVQHAVGLVQHQDLRPCRGSRPSGPRGRAGGPGVATRISTPLRELLDLRVDVHAAVDHERAQRHVLAVGAARFPATWIASSRVGREDRGSAPGAGAGEKLLVAHGRQALQDRAARSRRSCRCRSGRRRAGRGRRGRPGWPASGWGWVRYSLAPRRREAARAAARGFRKT